MTRPVIDAALVERLVRTRFPRWAGLPVVAAEPLWRALLDVERPGPRAAEGRRVLADVLAGA